MNLLRGPLLREGKTKKIWEVRGEPGVCIVESDDAVTKNDDPAATISIPGKGTWATETTCNIFRLLRAAGLPVAYHDRIGNAEFTAPACQMVPLECVTRRFAVGSILKRLPALVGAVPHRFRDPLKELYLKTTAGVCRGMDGGVLLTLSHDPLRTDGAMVEDPLIEGVHGPVWQLRHSKLPLDDGRSGVGTVPRSAVIADLETDYLMRLVGQVFEVLERAWGKLGCTLFDLKVELGFGPDNTLLVADVITADEWRLKDAGGRELSKQIFRSGATPDEVADMYRTVAEMSKELTSF